MGKHEAQAQADEDAVRAKATSEYDGRYGESEPAGDPDNDDAYAAGTAKDVDVAASHVKSQGQSGWV